MKYKIIKGRFGEGWKPGDIVDIDFAASRVRLEVGDIEVYKEPEVTSCGELAKPEESKPKFGCDECDFIAKNANGLRLHKRKHTPNK